ncbi:putative prophage integrase [Moraxella catarrhalis 7169]|uniref:tyrosine-type recombinase/integrase n=1 Tax=Moraxella catarrhalis TaxID=480 RepID=UPI0002029BB9|nr:tyrosine-type recombinase/integrase [Moraxella catarrhalis]EGE12410.1 putative prophage integrase [Moraxella catarrhalis 7169]
MILHTRQHTATHEIHTPMLTDNKIKGLKPTEKRYSLSAGEGLSIDVMPTGRKSWVLEYTAQGKRKRRKLGEYPAVSLKQARELSRKIKDNAGLTPITISELIHEWLELYSKQWKSEKYKYTVMYRLTYITNGFKDVAVADVSRAMVSKAVSNMVAQGTYETAKRSLRLLSQVFNYAIAHEYAQNNPCTLVNNIIPAHTVQNMATLSADEMTNFWQAVKETPTIGKAATALSLANYLAIRPSELCKAKWSEFDLNNALWIIPTHRMKMRLEHAVPLARQPLAILRKLYDERLDDDYVFKHRLQPNKPMPIESVLAVIKRAGFGGRMTTHGFRSLFSTVANDSGLWRADVIERQLAHTKKDIRHVYNRAEYWDERTELMQWWADIVADWQA